jgi:peptidoglycan/LPS O-acetylase OafA/YrhL
MVVSGAILVLALAECAKSSLSVPRQLLYLGEVSYAIYMVHVLVLLVFAKMLGQGPLSVALAIVAILAFASLCYHLVEVPGRKWLRRINHRSVHGEPAA